MQNRTQTLLFPDFLAISAGVQWHKHSLEALQQAISLIWLSFLFCVIGYKEMWISVFFIGQLSIFIYFILHNLLTGPEGICRKEMLKIPGELPQFEKILKRFEHEYLLTVTLCGNNK